MANLQKFRTHEALNTTAAGGFSVADASSGGLGGSSGAQITAGSSADVTNTKHMDLAPSTHQIMVYAAGDVYFNFATSDLDIDADIDLILPGGSLTSVAVPIGMKGASDTLRFNFNSTSTTAHAVRIVEV
jgi:hypothetical protein